MWEFSGLAGLFLAALGAATLLPLQSEAVLVGLLSYGQHETALLILIASLGNVGGSVINWKLGQYLQRAPERSWCPVSPAQLARATRHYQRYGYGCLLLSWMPVIGDPLTLIAGLMREPFWRFLLLVSLAKSGRYLVIAWMFA